MPKPVYRRLADGSWTVAITIDGIGYATTRETLTQAKIWVADKKRKKRERPTYETDLLSFLGGVIVIGLTTLPVWWG